MVWVLRACGCQLLTRCADPDMVSIQEGAVITLMVTLVFRSDDIKTKYCCSMALLNIAANESCRSVSRTVSVSEGSSTVWLIRTRCVY